MGIVRRRALFHRSSCSRSRRGRRDSSGLAACEDAKLGEMLFMCMTMNGVRKRITEDVRLGCDKAVSCKSVSKSDSTLRPVTRIECSATPGATSGSVVRKESQRGARPGCLGAFVS